MKIISIPMFGSTRSDFRGLECSESFLEPRKSSTEDKLDLLNNFEIIDAQSLPKFEHQIIGDTEDRVYLETDHKIFYKNHGTHVSAHELQLSFSKRATPW